MGRSIHLLTLLFATILLACSGGASTHTAAIRTKSDAELSRIKSPNTDNIELIFFHSRHHCSNCEAIEHLAREVVKEISSEEVEMKVVDITTKQGEKIGDTYEVAWTSLLLDNRGTVYDVTQLGLNSAKSNPAEFKQQLRDIISKLRR